MHVLFMPIIRESRRLVTVVAIVFFCTITLLAQGKKANTNVGQARLQIHVFVMPIVSSHSEPVVVHSEAGISYSVPVPRSQSEVTMQESALPPGTDAELSSKATLLTSTIVQP